MNAEDLFGLIFAGVIFAIMAAIMIGIGIFQIKSRVPVTFYTGEKPMKPEELSDVSAWNKKHGWMWVIYGMGILVFYGIGLMMGDAIYSAIPMCGGVVIPLPFMIWHHHRLIKIYKR